MSKHLCIFSFVILCMSILERSASAEVILFAVDTTASSLKFSGTLIVPNPGFSDILMPIQNNVPGDNLTTRLGGTFSADPIANQISSGGTVNQLDAIQGSVMNGGVRIGSMNLANLAFITASTPSLVTQAGGISYSVASAAPPLNVVGALGLNGGVLALGAPTFGTVNGLRTVDMSIIFNQTLPTVQSGVFLATQLTGTIHAIEVSAVPEPTHLGVAGLAEYRLSVHGAVAGLAAPTPRGRILYA